MATSEEQTRLAFWIACEHLHIIAPHGDQGPILAVLEGRTHQKCIRAVHHFWTLVLPQEWTEVTFSLLGLVQLFLHSLLLLEVL